MGIFGSKKDISSIRKVRLLGMRTARETLLLTTVNFTLYSFWVEYENGKAETIEVSPKNPNDKSGKEKKLFEKLMAYANAESGESISSTRDSDSILDDLKKLKDLLDAGVLPQDMYEEKRVDLLRELSTCSGISRASQKYNVTISRINKCSSGEAETLTYIDGKKLEASLDNSISLSLSEGAHTVSFRRAALRSKELEISILESKRYQINVAPKAFSIDVSVDEK
ncbi:MAG: hypothetical protein ACI4PC_07335 [Oscillospiraceae bacterium]